jgi:alpha-L-rhamnosidase
MLIVLNAVLLVAGCSMGADLSKVPQLHETPEQRDERMQWFRDAKFGMFIHWGLCSVGQKLSVAGLRCEYAANPLGVDRPVPRLSWQLQGAARGQKQTAYQILVASSEEKLRSGKGDLWDSGKVASGETVHVLYGGKPLASHQACFWKVQVWNEDDRVSRWSEAASWSMGVLDAKDWVGTWIGLDREEVLAPDMDPGKRYLPSVFLRRDFDAATKPVRAVVYVTAQGVTELHLNGKRVGDEYFVPGWTDYNKRIYYRAYDVTDGIRKGRNALGAIVGDGWFRGNISIVGQNRYGKHTRLLAQLHLFYGDGRVEVIATDNTWKAAFGPVLGSDMQAGETYDARREMPGWDQPDYAGGAWAEVNTGSELSPVRQAYPGVPVRKTAELKPVSVSEPKPGLYVFNMGQNFAGWARLKVREKAGTAVTMRFGEMLNADGTVYRANLRSARATDTYICKGGELELWEPRFTFHGYQYVQVEGLSVKPTADLLTGIVVHSDSPMTSTFACSNPLLNKLFSNITWGQRSNYLEVPTDCPQRDERLGWTGDTQVFVRTGAYNQDVAAFFTKWIVDLMDTQNAAGTFGNQAPVFHGHGSPAWADAGVIVPWTIYHVYGDTRVLAEHYEAMARFIGWYRNKSPGLIGPNEGFGDWLSVGGNTPRDLISTAYFAHAASLMARMAEALGKTEDAAKYRVLFADIRKAFQDKFVKADGTVGENSQTGYLMAFAFDLLAPEQKKAAGEKLILQIEARDWHLSTGFVGVSFLLPVLTQIGRSDVAYRLIQNTTYPSWGYSIAQGATTMWERWNSYTRDKGFGDVGMNSFNHYAYGSCGEWMFRTMLGIDAAEAGFKRLHIEPEPGGGLDSASGSYTSIRGRIESGWRKRNGRMIFTLTIPPNVEADVRLPVPEGDAVLEGGRPVTDSKGVRVMGRQRGKACFQVASGSYEFSWTAP